MSLAVNESKAPKRGLIGVISDTHGLIRPEALAALRGSALIIHAGDIGAPSVLDTLRTIAPVIAVRGNNDNDDWAEALPEVVVVPFGTVSIYVLHELKQLNLDWVKSGFQVIISGHSHRPSIERRDGVLFLNPGSAGPRRFSLPVCVAQLRISKSDTNARLIRLM
jgi:putative phosphoesterase